MGHSTAIAHLLFEAAPSAQGRYCQQIAVKSDVHVCLTYNVLQDNAKSRMKVSVRTTLQPSNEPTGDAALFDNDQVKGCAEERERERVILHALASRQG